jgi:hypothetical protein
MTALAWAIRRRFFFNFSMVPVSHSPRPDATRRPSHPQGRSTTYSSISQIWFVRLRRDLLRFRDLLDVW